ncbi:MAG: ABC transporter substrate-binding protein [Gudongella sp.]|nr:ABC transporter substrate-binding protein [Gudongella sp.]
MNKKLKFIGIISLILVLSMTITGCGDKQAEAPTESPESEQPMEQVEKTIVIAMPEEIEGTDVQQIRWDNLIHNLVSQPLATYNLELTELIPGAAESFEISDDGTEITFHLPANAKFSNDAALTAEAIKASMARYIETSPYSYDFDPIQEVIAVDDTTVVLKLDSAAAFLWPVLTSVYGGPIDANVAAEVGNDVFNRGVVSNGLYKVDNWVQGSQIEFVKNPNYQTFNPIVDNKGPALIDKLTVRFIPENFTRISELEAGTVDLVVDIPSENIDQIRNNENLNLYEYLQTGIDYIALNTNNEHLSDLNVRKALALAINKDEISAVLNDTVKTRFGLISESMLTFDQATEDKLAQEYAFNIDKAKTLLEEAGYKDTNGDGIVDKNGTELSLTLMVALDTPALKNSAPIIQAQLKLVGVDLKLNEYESPYIKQKIKDGEFDMATRFFWWSDPDILYYVIHSSADLPWENEMVDKYLDEGRYIMDLAERTAKYAQVQELTMAEVPLIPLFSEYEYMAARKEVTGIKLGADGKRVMMNDLDIK